MGGKLDKIGGKMDKMLDLVGDNVLGLFTQKTATRVRAPAINPGRHRMALTGYEVDSLAPT